MSPVNHPIHLNNVVFTRSIVISIPNFKEAKDGTGEPAPINNLDVEPIEDKKGHYQAIMQCKLNPAGDSSSRYLIDMECAGIFFAEDSLPKEEALRGVTITANSVLYGAIRESVAWLTSRQPYGTLLLGLSVLQPKTPTESK